MSNAEAISYENKLVVFIDILGFRQRVFNSKNIAKNTIGEIEQALNFNIEALGFENGSDWYSVKLFSDCLCLSCDECFIDSLFYAVSLLQWDLTGRDIFIRGGIAYGPHYESDRMIFSEGLINAYDLQTKSVYPRILIDGAIIKMVIDQKKTYIKEARLPYLIIAPDNMYFLDYLQGVNELGSIAGNLEDLLEAHKEAIITQLRTNVDNYNVAEKYLWVANYHNYKFNELYIPSEWVEGYFDTLKERLTIDTGEYITFKKP